jgi:8-amino-7-oxononanoate synthase
MNDFDHELGRELASIDEQGLRRQLRCVQSAQGPRVRIDGREYLNFSSNDYLGLANHPLLKQAASRAIEQYGSGAGASRLICGSLHPHYALEEALAAFKGTQAALAFSSGYAAAQGTICALVSRNDVVVLDRLVHASIVDAARLAGAKLRVFAHNDLNDLERILTWASSQQNPAPGILSRKRRVLVVTESVFSMDGDLAPLRDIVALKEQHGAWLMVDEAHATGLYGTGGRGLAAAEGVAERVEIQMGTLGKALGSAGGYICGSRNLVDLLINRARSFIFSTAPVPAAAAAATAGVELVQSGEGQQRTRALWHRVSHFLSLAGPALPIREDRICSAIVPILLGREADAVNAAGKLRERGIFIPAVRYPTVARGKARLRLTLTAAHTDDDIKHLQLALAGVISLPRDSAKTSRPPSNLNESP